MTITAQIDLRNWEGWRTEPRDRRGRWTRAEIEKAIRDIATGKTADEAAAAEKQAAGISMLAQFGGKSAQLSVIRNQKSLGDLQAADYGFQQRAAKSSNPKVTAAHQMVRDEIAKRGGKLADLTAPVRVRSTAEIAQQEKKDLVNAWSTSYRYKGTTEAKDKRIADFAVELHRLLSTNKQPVKCGAGCQDAHKFLSMVDKDATVQPKELQRAITLGSAAAGRMFKPGKTLDMPVASWTSDPGVGGSYLKSEKNGKYVPTPAGKVKVLIHAAPGAKGLDISALSIWHGDAATGAGGEQETVTGGRMNVDKVETVDGVMHVYVTQKDFSAN